ncbi:ATP-dependent RecD-like DNA helicase [Tumebacillus sp. ITR2]|uniref:ATP-dependent RecD2 DNA helicase n=1 Tax=Tumebacillus amylolyticus TaxID=2801339 RepID=A0ABS1J5G1_9BACL|nr:ATP-dependent RecD-like DNA helicase [Tumebacillus amylolyticus]MBL0385503.1 ATP-dependent RecD-like DNA helicase [Tumebacillus amylolyticus]
METYEGRIKKITFQAEDDGYTIATLVTEGEKSVVTVVGTMPGLVAGDLVKVSGSWSRHDKFGPQLQVEMWEKVMPQTREGILKYLSSGLVKGIGKATAKKLVESFGVETLQVLERFPERITEVEGIGEKKAERILKSFREQRGVQTLVYYLASKGVPTGIAARIYKRYGAESVAILEENPYRLADEVPGIGFKSADTLAQQIGIPPLAPSRLKFGLKFTLMQAADDGGHVYLPLSELLEKGLHLLGPETAPHLAAALQSLTEERTGGVKVEDGRVYLTGFYYMEEKTAERLRILIGSEGMLDDADPQVVEAVEREEGLSLAPLQREAVEAVLSKRVVVVTGGPGTGKTTTVKAMIAALAKQGIRPVLAAPTGRAAKRMTESTGVESKTLHRLLEYGQVEGEGLKFQRDEDNRLEGRVFIVDEASMIDLYLFHCLLRALPDDARLVLCGDIDQLPSVGAGRVLQDVIDSGSATVVRLLTIFRQAGESYIVKNAHRINQGQLPQSAKDFFFVEQRAVEDVIAYVIDLVTRRLPKYLQGDPLDNIQVLVPMRKGPLGVDALNEHLQAALNPPSPDKREFKQFRVGDKVMQIRNHYQKDVYNGDVGRIVELDPEEEEVTVEFPEGTESRHVTYQSGELDHLTLAYAVSVHKSQGSEYPCVVFPVVFQHRVMLQRNLLYTGVTRAKQLVMLVGNKGALQFAVRNADNQHRYSGLAQRIQRNS